MPLPKPKSGESQDSFIKKCMSSSQMKKEFPNKDQRLAVCFSQFKKKALAEDDEMQTRDISFDLELYALDDEKGEFEGHAALFDKPDRFGEIIVPGAFKKSLHKDKKRVKMLRGHDQNAIIGVWEVIKEDADGLFVKGRLLLQLQAAAEAFILLKEQALDALSIGFLVIKDEFDTEKKRSKLLEIALLEISLVTIPRQPGALVTNVRSVAPEEITTKRELEKALRDAGFSTATSGYISAGWTPPALRDAEGGNELVRRIQRLTESLTATGN